MATDTRFGAQTEAEWQRVRDTIRGWAGKEVAAGREFTTGILLEDVRTKEFPEDAAPGQPTEVAFVANVKLIEVSGRPVVRDCLVANQARQWVADAIGTPVLLKIDKTGNMQVIGRAAVNFDDNDDYVVKYVPIHDIDGNNLDFLFGLDYVQFADLSVDLRTQINAYRATLGLPPLYVPVSGTVYGGTAPTATVHLSRTPATNIAVYATFPAFNGYLDEIRLYLNKVGSPSGNIRVRLREYDTAQPQDLGAVIEEIEIFDAATLPGSPGWHTSTPAAPIPLALVDNLYWIEIRSDLPVSATDYITVHLEFTVSPSTNTLVERAPPFGGFLGMLADLMYEVDYSADGDAVYVDPVVYVLGEDYMPGYIPTDGGPRGSTGGTLTCRQETVIVPWNDPRWQWGSAPTGWPAGTSSWGLKETITICNSTP